MTKLSVNINKIATLRNSRGGDLPNVVKAALDAERFGAQGITVHPRPDERHIRYADVRDIKRAIATELNIEGNPIGPFVDLVLEVRPTQVTLVPDAHDAITSNAGWDTVKHKSFLREVIGGSGAPVSGHPSFWTRVPSWSQPRPKPEPTASNSTPRRMPKATQPTAKRPSPHMSRRPARRYATGWESTAGTT